MQLQVKDIEKSMKGSELLSPVKDIHCYQMVVEPETFHTVRMADDIGWDRHCRLHLSCGFF